MHICPCRCRVVIVDCDYNPCIFVQGREGSSRPRSLDCDCGSQTLFPILMNGKDLLSIWFKNKIHFFPIICSEWTSSLRWRKLSSKHCKMLSPVTLTLKCVFFSRTRRRAGELRINILRRKGGLKSPQNRKKLQS